MLLPAKGAGFHFLKGKINRHWRGIIIIAAPDWFFVMGSKDLIREQLTVIQCHLMPCLCTTKNLFSRRRCYLCGKISIWHILSVYSVTVFAVITMIVALPLLSAIVFPVKRRNRHSLVGPQQAGGRPAPVRRSNTMPPNLGNAGLLGRMLDEKSPPSPSGTFLSHGR